MRAIRRRAATPRTIVTNHLDHPYVRRTTAIVVDLDPDLAVEPLGHDRWGPAMTGGKVVVHLHWIDVLLRRSSRWHALVGAVRLLLYVAVLRLAGVGLVWTVHNAVGKAHSRVGLDRAVRTVLVLLCDRVVVLNPGAAAVTRAELPAPLSRRFDRIVRVVPMPLSLTDHGLARSREEARRELDLNTSLPVVAYLPGANQPDHTDRIGDGGRRYELIALRRSDDQASLRRVESGWELVGRPSDEVYGTVVCAADALVLTDDRAFASMTLHTAVDLGRPVIARRCPATEELLDLGGGVAIDGVVDPDSIAAALQEIDAERASEAFAEFRRRHDDAVVARALAGVYRGARLWSCPRSATDDDGWTPRG